MPSRAAFAAGLVVALVAAGCAGVPDNGKAVRVRSIAPGITDTDPEVRQQPRPARPGDTPERVVRGFLAAAKSPPERHAIARTYLAPNAVTGWNDAATRVVTLGAQRVAGTAGSPQVIVTGRYQGRLDADLAYLPEEHPMALTFTLRRVDGQWRITNPPPGVLLSAPDFAQVYQPLDLYFLNRGNTTVIPDRRYFDVGKPAVLPTDMATRLLAGPSAWLKPGVHTAFPSGTRLRSNVIKDGDEYVIDLSVEVLAASGAQQAELAAQLVWTLAKQFPVSGVRVLADGRPLRVQSQNGVVARDAYPSYDPRILSSPVSGYYLAGGTLHIAGQPATGQPAPPPVTGLRSAAISADLGWLAAVRPAAAGAALATGPVGGALTSHLVARTLTRPSWEAGADGVFVGVDGRAVLRVGTDGSREVVDVPGLAAAGPVTAVVLARDGVRVALVAGRPGHGRLLLAVVQQTTAKTTLVGLREVAPSLTGVVDVAWADEGHLLVLAARAGTGVAPYGVDSDGFTVSERVTTGLPADRQGVAAAPGEPDLVAAGGRIWQRQGSLWTSPFDGPVPVGGQPFYPG